MQVEMPSLEPKKSKFIQILQETDDCYMLALDDEGQIWKFEAGMWMKISMKRKRDV